MKKYEDLLPSGKISTIQNLKYTVPGLCYNIIKELFQNVLTEIYLRFVLIQANSFYFQLFLGSRWTENSTFIRST
jgi:hypothetical protein